MTTQVHATRLPGLEQFPLQRELARRGVEFRRAYTVPPVCSPARASMLTGRYPHAHGLNENDGRFGGRAGLDPADWMIHRPYNIDRYAARIRASRSLPASGVDPTEETPPPAPEPHAAQREALEALDATRRAGNRAGLNRLCYSRSSPVGALRLGYRGIPASMATSTRRRYNDRFNDNQRPGNAL